MTSNHTARSRISARARLSERSSSPHFAATHPRGQGSPDCPRRTTETRRILRRPLDSLAPLVVHHTQPSRTFAFIHFDPPTPISRRPALSRRPPHPTSAAFGRSTTSRTGPTSPSDPQTLSWSHPFRPFSRPRPTARQADPSSFRQNPSDVDNRWPLQTEIQIHCS